MAVPWALLGSAAGAGALLGTMGGSKGSTSIATSVSQQVTQAANTNVNPIIAVTLASPNAHYDQKNPLEPDISQSPITEQTDAWRHAAEPGTELVGYGGTEYGPYTSDSDQKVTTADSSFLTSLISPTTLLLVGGALVAILLFKKFM